ncbi:flavodoxin family protein [Methanoculleus bourgensis]|uniref:Flavodoxin-like domain-containing protein n=1 Tax=Methanoculleus bourgensis TaxID=83986 RepID=A0A0X8XYY4_9EURY|nr:hypothetical protein [Methanoculleus bourgensis]CVK34597.1 protein of unknown function [Methanoculleus bourgensis]
MSHGVMVMVLIVYYSWQGHTEKVARALAERVGGRLARIEPVSEVGTLRKAMMATFGMRAAIHPTETDLSGVDFLIVATPVWAQKLRLMSTSISPGSRTPLENPSRCSWRWEIPGRRRWSRS